MADEAKEPTVAAHDSEAAGGKGWCTGCIFRMFRFYALLLFLLTPGLPSAAGEIVPMQGVPPSVESQVTPWNWVQSPYSHWAFRNMGLKPSVMVPRRGPVRELPVALRAGLEDLRFEYAGKSGTVLEALLGDSTDGVVVIQGGKILYEHYFGGFGAHDHHLWASSTKSMVSSAAGILVDRGVQRYLSKFKADTAREPGAVLTINHRTSTFWAGWSLV
ncbi:MAG: hypothetical protein VCC00_07990 [Deltaproteobacteria bacterium]